MENEEENKNGETSPLEELELPDVEGLGGDVESEPANEMTELERAQAEATINYDKYVRAMAELENVKRRNIKERAELLKYDGERFSKDILEIVDNLERAVSHAVVTEEGPGEAMEETVTEEAGSPTVESRAEIIKGLQLIVDSFHAILDKHGIKSESSVGAVFDPTKQEALAMMPVEGTASGTVIEEYKKAYFFKGKLLRAAQVVVAQ